MDPESYQEEGIPNHLVSMIQILIDEERETKEEHFQHRNGQQTNANMPVSSPSKFNTVDHYQPCLEFFVQKKIMETLCMIAQKDVSLFVILLCCYFNVNLKTTNSDSKGK